MVRFPCSGIFASTIAVQILFNRPLLPHAPQQSAHIVGAETQLRLRRSFKRTPRRWKLPARHPWWTTRLRPLPMSSNATGAVVSGAKISVTSQATSRVLTAQSSGRGEYAVDALMPGKYKVEVQAANFKTATRLEGSIQNGGFNEILEFGSQIRRTLQSVRAAFGVRPVGVRTHFGNDCGVRIPLRTSAL